MQYLHCNLIRQESVPRDVTFSGKVKIWCVYGDDEDHPLADVSIQVDGQEYLFSVGIMDKLPYQVVLGRDRPIFWDLIAKAEENDPCVSGEIMMAVTESKHSTHHSEPSLSWSEMPFADSKVPVVKESRHWCARKSRVQRRQDKVRGTKIVEPVPEPSSDELM